MFLVMFVFALFAALLQVGPFALFAALLQVDPVTASNYELWLVVSAALTVMITSGINMLPPHFTDLHKRIIAGALSAIMATVTVFYQGLLDTTDWARTWLVIFMAATTAYVVIVKPILSATRRS